MIDYTSTQSKLAEPEASSMIETSGAIGNCFEIEVTEKYIATYE
jgi:hypothetical protein